MNWLGKLAVDLRVAEDRKQDLEESIHRWKNESKSIRERRDQVNFEIEERKKLLYQIDRELGERLTKQRNASQALKPIQRTIDLYVLHAITCGD